MKNWKKYTISSFAETQSGGTPSTFKKEYWDGNIPWINSGELKDCNIYKASKFITEQGLKNSSAKLLPTNTVVIALTGATTAKVGLLKIETSANQSVTGIIPNEKFDSMFLFYKLISMRKEILKNAIGTAQPHINKRIVDNIEIELPLIVEQQAIVSKIEELFSELDKGIEQLKATQQQLKTYRQSVLKWAFEGKLTEENVKDDELPQGWKWVNIEFLLSDKKKGMATGPFGTMLKKNEHQLSGVPVLGIENIGENIFQMPNKIFITEEKAVELKNFRVKENDIIISRSGTVGEICLLPKAMENSIISTNLIKVSLNLRVINPKYFVYLFQGGKVRQQVFDLCKGSSRAFLNQTILNSLDFPYCSIEEQNNIVQEIESRLSVADKMEESITQSLQQAEALRQSILKKAFEGRLVQHA